MAALHGWRVPEDSPEIRGDGDPRRAPWGVDLIAGGRERPRRVRRPEPVGSVAGRGEWGYPSAGADSRWWVPTEGGGGVAWLIGGGGEGSSEAGERIGEGEEQPRQQRESNGTVPVCLCYVAAVRPVTPSDASATTVKGSWVAYYWLNRRIA